MIIICATWFTMPFWHMEASEINRRVDTSDGFVNVLVIFNGVSSYVWLWPVRACMATFVAGYLVAW